MPNKNKSARERAMELMLRNANNGTKNTIRRDGSTKPGSTVSSNQTNTTTTSQSTSTSQSTNSSATAQKSPQTAHTTSQGGSQGTSYNDKFYHAAGRKYTSNTKGNDRRRTTSANARNTTAPKHRVDDEVKSDRPTLVVGGAGKQWLGGHIAGVGTAMQQWETDDKSILEGKYIGGENGRKKYSTRRSDRLTESQAKEKAEGRRMSKGSRGVGVSVNDFERVYDVDPNSLSQKLIKKGDEWIESGGQDIEQAKEGLGTLGKVGVDLVANGVQMLGDRALAFVPVVGQALAMGSLMNRAGGTASYEGRQSGMNADQQYQYALGTSVIEGLSEAMFNSVSAFKSTYGKGALSIADNLSFKTAASGIVNRVLKSDTGRAIAYNLARLGGGALEEGTEELVAGITEPALKYMIMKSTDPNATYDVSLKDLGYDFMIGALMGGIPGSVDMIRGVKADVNLANSEAYKAFEDGNAYAQQYMDKAKVQGRMQDNGRVFKSDAEVLAEKMQKQIDNGGQVLPGQTRRLMEALNESYTTNETSFRNKRARNYQEAAKKGETNNVVSSGSRAENEEFAGVSYEKELEYEDQARDLMGDNAKEESVEAVGRVLASTADSADVDTVLLDPDAKAALEILAPELQDSNLPVKPAEAREAIENVISSREIATRDSRLQEAQDRYAKNIEASLGNMREGAKELLSSNYQNAVSAMGDGSGGIYKELFNRIYIDGTTKGADFEKTYDNIIANNDKAIQEAFPKEFAKKIFDQGRMANVATVAKETAQAKAAKYAEQNKIEAHIEEAAKKYVDQQTFEDIDKFAKRSKVRVEIVEHLVAKDDNGNILYDENGKELRANGKYENGVIYIAADSDNKFITIAKHELTHHIKEISPERYQELEDFVFQRWYNSDSQAMQDAIVKYQKLYQNITPQQAKEEIIADASEAFFTDEGAIQDVCSFSGKLAKALSDGIHSLLDTFLTIQNADKKARGLGGQFLKQMNILKDAERMWAEALDESVNSDRDAKNEANVDLGTEAKHSLGYHAGDLGKSTGDDYWGIKGRSTGHFGFGTYFVGDKMQISDDYYGKRPLESVDFDKYNLFKPRNYEDGERLHDALKKVNDYIKGYNDFSKYFNIDYGTAEADEWYQKAHGINKDLDDFLWDLSSGETPNADVKARINKFISEMPESNRNKIDSKAQERYEKDDSISLSDWRYYEAQNVVENYTKEWNEKRHKLQNLAWDLAYGLNFRFSQEEIENALKATDRVISKYDNYKRGLDSASTVFMKQLGYEGVDVRGIKGLDNTSYGSVIYDLKGEDLARKKEIGTAKYSISPSLLSDLESIRNVKPKENTGELLIGTTSDFLMNNFGINSNRVTMSYEKAFANMVTKEEALKEKRFNKNLNYHGLGVNGLYNALYSSENPVFAFVSEDDFERGIDRGDTVALVTDKKDKNGNYIIVYQRLHDDVLFNKKWIKSDKIVTTFSRDNLNTHIENALKNGKMLFADKKRSQAILGITGKRLTSSLNADFNNNIDHFIANVKYLHKEVTIKKPAPATFNLGDKLKEAQAKKDAKGKSNTQSGKLSLKANDQTYLDAVNRGDMETAQRMVEQEARKKGYNSPLLYSGTNHFGYTEINAYVNGGDGSFWASNREDTAGTYTILNRSRKISSKMNEDEKENLREELYEETENRIDDVIDEFRGLIDSTFSEWYFGQQSNEVIRDAVMNANPEVGYGDGVYDVLDEIVFDAYHNYQDEAESHYDDFDEWRDSNPEAEKIYGSIVELESLRSNLEDIENGDLKGGVYQLYANTNNMYEMDAKGALWDNLRPEGLPKLQRNWSKDAPYRTRDVVEWAKNNGYDGVIFRNIKDNGQYGRTGDADVYAFLNPQAQVKSADPVTYDDNGEVIPLSERFNKKNEGIRYSLSGDGGYDGRSMSNRARRAYESGEKPISKWTKAEIITAINDINPDIDVSKLTVKELRDNFLYRSSWHHTGKYYNRTDFYSINENVVDGLTQEDINSLKATGSFPVRASRDFASEYENKVRDRKQKQFDILQKANSMLDSYHTGIRSVDDIKTFGEVEDELWGNLWNEYGRDANEHTNEVDPAPDYTFEDMREASSTGKVTIYSSKPIVNGAFVTPSMQEAINYAGDGNFYQAEVPLEDVAWIDSIEGQYAKTSDEDIESIPRFSITLAENRAPKPYMRKDGNDVIVGDELFKDGNGNPLMVSGLEITADTMNIMGKNSEVPALKRFLKRMANYMRKMGETYTFIGLEDVQNATLQMRYDKDGKPVSIVVSAMVKNGEYPVNFDFSSICKKRQALSKLFEELSKKGEDGENFLDTVELTQENLWEINKILSANGFETACLGCFVETKRYNIEDWADGFVEKWNKAVKAVNPNAKYFDFASSTDIDYGYVSDELDKFAEEKANEKKKESDRRKRERSSWKKKWLKNNPGKTEADAEKAFKDWWKKQYNKKTTDYKESWFENPALSNDKQITALVNSSEKMQGLLRKTDLISPKGLKALMGLHHDFYGVLYGHYGSGTPKPMVSFTPYNSEIALLDRKMNRDGTMKKYTKEDNDKLIKQLIEIGGVRVQSFSDFLIQNTFDYLQMISDLAARDFPAHGYTKEIAFAKIFGMTGMKINLSVMFDVDPNGIAPGLDKDGNYVVADRARQEKEKKKGNQVFQFSIPYDEAVKLQNQKGYDGNIGIIGVGLSDLHIRKMLNDINIKMVIPYHASGMPAILKQLTGLGSDSDYTSTQNTLDITKIVKDGKDVTKQFDKEYMLDLYKKTGSWKKAFAQFRKDTEGCEITTKKAFNSVGDFPLYTGDSTMSLDATNDPKLTAEYYMGWCIEQGHFPLFYQFADEENYYKVLYDFNVYHNDGTYAPQQAVTNTYPTDLAKTISYYMNKANNFEQAQMPRWGVTIEETKKMLKSNSYTDETKAKANNGKFSLSESSEAAPTTKEYKSTIKKLEEQVADLKSEFKRTNLKTADPKQVRIQAGRFLKRHDANNSLHGEVVDAFNKIFGLYKEKGTDAFAEVYEIAQKTAVDVVNSISVIHDEGAEDYKAIKDYLKNTEIKVSDEMKRNITDYNDFRKHNFGRLKLVNGETSNIDNVYMELMEMFPGQFTEDYVNPADQLYHIVDVLDNYAPYYESLDGASEEMQDYVVDIASDIMETAYNLQTKKTFADKKYEQKIKAVKKAREEAFASRKKALDRQKQRYEEKIEALKQHNKDFKVETRERAEKKRRIKQISNVYKRLLEKLQTPTDTKHLPADYEPVVSNVLKMFDFTTPGMEKWAERNGEPSKRYKYMLELRKQLDEMSKNDTGVEVDPDLLDLIDEIMADIGENEKLVDLDSSTLEDIATLFRAFEHQMNTYNKAFDENNKKATSETAHSIFNDLDKIGDGKGKWKLGVMGRLLTSNFNPSDFFELLGGDVADLYNATRKGFDKYVDRLDNAKTFLQDRVDNKKADKWANHVATYKTSSGEEIELTDTQLMSLYCLNKREQAQGHIYGGGIVSAPLKVKNKKKLIPKELEKKRVIPSIEDVGRWFNTLTDEQKQVANDIQRYFVDEVSAWGNETSMKLYNYKKFGEPNYFPIQSSKDYMASNFDQRGEDPVLKNIGASKATVKNANNVIVIDDIFTVFSKHVAQMASYNAYVPAITDFQRVWNYTEGNDQDMVKARFERVYGRKAADYIENFFKNLNGVYKANFDPTIFDKGLGLFKKAAVGGNIRVLVQQPTAIARSALLINPAYLTAAVPLATAHPKQAYRDMMEHCPIARWKTWGFYSSDITSASRDLKNIMIGKDALTDKIFMNMYGTADNVTWTVIFKACQLQVEAQNKGLEKGSDEYWEKVNDLASRVFDRTQVVDSPFHRSELMKSQDGLVKAATAFMAEPTKTINMLNTELTKAMTEFKNGHPARAVGLFTRVAMVITANAAALAVAQAMVDAMRHAGGDDDKDKGDYEDRFKNYWKSNFTDNLNPFGMIPYIKDIKSLWDGYDVLRLDMNGVQKIIKSIQYVQKYYEDPAASKYSAQEEWTNLALNVMYTVGVPISNAKRDIEGLYVSIMEGTGHPEVFFHQARRKYQLNDKTKGSFVDMYYDALKGGNTALANEIHRYLIKGGITEKYIKQRKRTWEKHQEPTNE